MTPTNGHLILEDEYSFKVRIRLLFEINPVDLRKNRLKKEGMMAEPPATYNHIIRKMKTWRLFIDLFANIGLIGLLFIFLSPIKRKTIG